MITMNWKQKKKFLRATITVFAIMLIILYAFVSCAGTEKKEVIVEEQEEQRIEYAGVIEYEVGPFETLSHIAVKFIPSDEYMQEWISDVKRLNGRKTSDIYSGETIKVFTYE
jgi:hypothetical protein